MKDERTLLAYRRENGRVGIRNHVIILPLDDISNAACEAVGNNIKGTLAIPHPYGRLQFGANLDLHFRTLIGTGSNPNVAAVVVIGIEPGWTDRVVDGIAKTGKPVAGFAIEQNGDLRTIAEASHTAKEFVHWASERRREECEDERPRQSREAQVLAAPQSRDGHQSGRRPGQDARKQVQIERQRHPRGEPEGGPGRPVEEEARARRQQHADERHVPVERKRRPLSGQAHPEADERHPRRTPRAQQRPGQQPGGPGEEEHLERSEAASHHVAGQTETAEIDS